MLFFRWAVLFLLIASGVCFAFYAATANKRYLKWGWIILRWTLLAAFGFFAVLIAERVA